VVETLAIDAKQKVLSVHIGQSASVVLKRVPKHQISDPYERMVFHLLVPMSDVSGQSSSPCSKIRIARALTQYGRGVGLQVSSKS